MPASAPGVLRVETAGGAVKIIPVDLPAVAEEEKWNGAVAVGTMVYGAPSNAYDILVLDTSTEEVTGVSLLTFGSIYAPLKFAGAAGGPIRGNRKRETCFTFQRRVPRAKALRQSFVTVLQPSSRWRT